ncbi:TPA: DEAD/DEAH box helicase [Yersinia enterocolitica]|nr:DEAD/DEAH box helicase [Yersinia enterocolitica]
MDDTEFTFHSLQKLVYSYLIKKNNVVLSASTSVGKSAIIDSIIASKQFNRTVIIVPTIALIDETRRRLSDKFQDDFQIITHPSQVASTNKTIYILTQERVMERQDLNEIDIFILDEFYKLNINSENDSRSILLNIAFLKLLKSSKQFYLIGPNIDYVIGLKQLGLSYIFIPSEFSTVALNIYEFDLPTHDDQRIIKTAELLKNDSDSTMIYCQSPVTAVKVAEELIERNCGNKTNVDDNFTKWLIENYHKDWIIVKALLNGIGIHHGSLPRAIQQKMIRLFNEGKIKILVCTSTIIEGVNTSAKNVIIYDRRSNRSVVSNFTHRNIQGRAGRMGRHFVGNVYCLESIPDNEGHLNEVNIITGTQPSDIPLNLLYGVDGSYLTESSVTRMAEFESGSILDANIISMNTKYPPQRLEELAVEIRKNILSNWQGIFWGGMPNKNQMRTLSDYILILEQASLSRVHLSDGDTLSTFLIQYLSSSSYSSFLKNKISHYQGNGDISNTIDWLLKTLRNAIGHNIPSAISTISSIIEYLCKRMKLVAQFDYRLIAYKFENSHLPSIYNALDEFGIPIQVAEKLILKNLEIEELDLLVMYLKKNYIHMPNLTIGDIAFIKESL